MVWPMYTDFARGVNETLVECADAAPAAIKEATAITATRPQGVLPTTLKAWQGTSNCSTPGR